MFNILNEEFLKYYPTKNINDKDYVTTSIRNIVLLILYDSYKKKIIKREEILFFFQNKDISNVYKLLKSFKTKYYKNDQNFILENKEIILNPKLHIVEYFNFILWKRYKDYLKSF